MFFTFKLNQDKENESTCCVLIPNFDCFGSHFQIRIECCSGIRVVFGRLEKKYFVCMPEMGKACEIANLWDEESNAETLRDLFEEPIDGIAVAKSLLVMQNHYGL